MSREKTFANPGDAHRKLAKRYQDIDISQGASADLKMAVDVFRGPATPNSPSLVKSNCSCPAN